MNHQDGTTTSAHFHHMPSLHCKYKYVDITGTVHDFSTMHNRTETHTDKGVVHECYTYIQADLPVCQNLNNGDNVHLLYPVVKCGEGTVPPGGWHLAYEDRTNNGKDAYENLLLKSGVSNRTALRCDGIGLCRYDPLREQPNPAGCNGECRDCRKCGIHCRRTLSGIWMSSIDKSEDIKLVEACKDAIHSTSPGGCHMLFEIKADSGATGDDRRTIIANQCIYSHDNKCRSRHHGDDHNDVTSRTPCWWPRRNGDCNYSGSSPCPLGSRCLPSGVCDKQE